MRVLNLGVLPTVLVQDEATAEAWMVAHKMSEDERDFLRPNFQWIDVLTIYDVHNGKTK